MVLVYEAHEAPNARPRFTRARTLHIHGRESHVTVEEVRRAAEPAQEPHALRRHDPKAEPAESPPQGARPLERHVVALEAAGWRVVELRPLIDCGEAALWRAAITRVDLDASMAVSAVDPDAALAELVRYASADAKEPR